MQVSQTGYQRLANKIALEEATQTAVSNWLQLDYWDTSHLVGSVVLEKLDIASIPHSIALQTGAVFAVSNSLQLDQLKSVRVAHSTGILVKHTYSRLGCCVIFIAPITGIYMNDETVSQIRVQLEMTSNTHINNEVISQYSITREEFIDYTMASEDHLGIRVIRERISPKKLIN